MQNLEKSCEAEMLVVEKVVCVVVSCGCREVEKVLVTARCLQPNINEGT